MSADLDAQGLALAARRLAAGRLGPQLTGFHPGNTLRWRRGRSLARAGVRNARIGFIGDSTTGGVGATAQMAVPERFAALARARGWPVYAEHLFGSVDAPDPRLIQGSWTAALGTAGGDMQHASAAGAPLVFTPTQPFDTIVVGYPTNGPLGSFAVGVDSGANLGIVNQSGAPALASTTLTVPLGSHSVQLSWASGLAFIASLRVYDSTRPGLEIANLGWSSSKAGDWLSEGQPWEALAAVQAYAADLWVINLGINDWLNGPTPVSVFEAAMTTLVTAAKLSGDVVLATPTPTAGNIAHAPAIVAAIRRLARQLDVGLYDLAERWGDEAALTASAPEWMSDGIHPSAGGYADIAEGLVPLLTA